MKKLLFLAIAMLSFSMTMAVPAYRGAVSVTQPDGSMLTLRVHGDEYLHFCTTDDGYSVVRRDDGFYAYAQLNADGQLEATNRMAHNPGHRSAAEKAWLEGVTKKLAPRMTQSSFREQQAENNRRLKTRQRATAKASAYDYSKFKGLVLLIEFNDRKFSRTDYAEVINDMVNKPDYKGYDNSINGRYTGSVHDYFCDNSMGMFSPEFDVVGPITLNVSQYYPKGTTNATKLTLKAIEAADSLVDFSQYDTDGDGMVDMVYFIFAGLGSHMGNDERLLWPHAGVIFQEGGQWGWEYVTKDNVWLGRYACSTELYGTKDFSFLDGIGVICHEFGHVLGLPDLYDTDYEGSGGESHHPGSWCIMAGGGYENNGRTPVGYSLYERYALGFATPRLLNKEENVELEPIGDSNQGYRINTPTNKEFFLLENRQKTSKWDQYLPGHGLLVFRVDSTNRSVWENNSVNNNPSRNYFELLRAKKNNSGQASAGDPFPGSGRVTILNNVTTPANLLSYRQKPCNYGLENITEKGGVISFDVVDLNTLKDIALPEELVVGRGFIVQMVETRTPDYAPCTLKWSTSDPSVATVDVKGRVTGISEGEAVITVTANDDELLTAQCTVKVVELEVKNSLAAFKAMEPNSEGALQLTDALVVFANDNVAYLRDSSGALKVNVKGLGLETGDKLNGVIYGRLGINDGVPQLQEVEGTTNSSGFSVTKGHIVEPRRVSLTKLSQDDYSDLVTIDTVRLERASGVWAISGDTRVRLYNSFQLRGIAVPTAIEGKYFDVTGIYATNKLNGAPINEIEMTVSPVQVEAPSAITVVATDAAVQQPYYDLHGRRVATPIKGLYIQNGKIIIK